MKIMKKYEINPTEYHSIIYDEIKKNDRKGNFKFEKIDTFAI